MVQVSSLEIASKSLSVGPRSASAALESETREEGKEGGSAVPELRPISVWCHTGMKLVAEPSQLLH